MKYEEITSRKNKQILFACSLKDKKERDAEKLFYFEGFKLLDECLKSDFSLYSLFFTAFALNKYESLLSRAAEKNPLMFLVSDEVYEKLTEEKAPQGIFTVARQRAFSDFPPKDNKKGIIFLDGVQNPQNLGAVARSAYALGSYTIAYTADCADVYNSKAVRAAMGATFNVDFCPVRDIESTFCDIKQSGRRIFATLLSSSAKSILNVKIKGGDCLVIGSEGKGVSERVASLCDEHLIIPMKNKAESLNASAACAIFIWEANRDE